MQFNDDNILTILWVIMCLGMLFLGISGSNFYAEYKKIKANEEIRQEFEYKEKMAMLNAPKSEEEIIENCQNLPLFNTSLCLWDNIKPIFNYTVRDEREYKGKDGTFDDLIIYGGDCYDWNMLYKNLLLQLGFDVYEIHLPSHLYVIVYNEETYCILDQTAKPYCVRYNPK